MIISTYAHVDILPEHVCSVALDRLLVRCLSCGWHPVLLCLHRHATKIHGEEVVGRFHARIRTLDVRVPCVLVMLAELYWRNCEDNVPS